MQQSLFPIEHDVYEVNRPENRLIRTALEVVCKKTKDANNWKLAQELRLMTTEIPPSQKIQQDFRQWQSGRLLALYSEIKPWTELILGEYMPVSTQGEWRGMSLLFPMEKLFEYFVAYHLRRGMPEYQVKTQHATEHICEHQQNKIFKLKPDIFIDRSQANAKNIVMDTKWKLIDQNDRGGRYGLKDSDIQQMFAYSHYYLKHESEVILVYPYRAGKFDQPLDDFGFRHTHGAKLKVVPFNLDEPQNFKII